MGSTADGPWMHICAGDRPGHLRQLSQRYRRPAGCEYLSVSQQIGKAFRNEIVARQFLFRMREFEQMEMQFFVRPGEEVKWFEFWRQTRLKWHRNLGLGDDKYRLHDHEKLAHYANAATDIEFEMPFGFRRWRVSTPPTSTSPSMKVLRQKDPVF